MVHNIQFHSSFFTMFGNSSSLVRRKCLSPILFFSSDMYKFLGFPSFIVPEYAMRNILHHDIESISLPSFCDIQYEKGNYILRPKDLLFMYLVMSCKLPKYVKKKKITIYFNILYLKNCNKMIKN